MSRLRNSRRPSGLVIVVAVTTIAMLVVLAHVLLSLGQIARGLSDSRIVATQTANGQRDLLLLQHAIGQIALGAGTKQAQVRRGLALQQLKTVARHAGNRPEADNLVARLRAIDLTALSAAPGSEQDVRDADRRIAAIEREFKVLYDGSDLIFQRTIDEALSARAGAQRLLAWLIALTLILALTTALRERRRARGDLRRAYDALHESERRFRSLAQNAFDLTLLTDATGLIVYASPALTRLTGVPPEAAVGRRLSEFPPPEDMAILDALVQRLASGPAERASVEFAVANETPLTLDGTALNLLDDPAGERDTSSTSVM